MRHEHPQSGLVRFVDQFPRAELPPPLRILLLELVLLPAARPHELPGGGPLEPLRRSALRLHLGHRGLLRLSARPRRSQACALGLRMMCSIRPSSRGLFSVLAMSCVDYTILLCLFQAPSVCEISVPLKGTVSLVWLPSSIRRRMCLRLKSKSWFSV